jgi:hypothetical protein
LPTVELPSPAVSRAPPPALMALTRRQFLWLSPSRRVIDSLLLLFLVLQLPLFSGVRFRSGVRLGMTTYMKKSQVQSLMCSCAFFAFLIEASSMDISTFFKKLIPLID